MLCPFATVGGGEKNCPEGNGGGGGGVAFISFGGTVGGEKKEDWGKIPTFQITRMKKKLYFSSDIVFV